MTDACEKIPDFRRKVVVASGYRGEDGGWVRLQNWGHPVLGEGWVQSTDGGVEILT